MDEDKISLDFGLQALAFSEEHEDTNLNQMKRLAEIMRLVSLLLADMISNQERLKESTATLRYINAE